MNEPYIVYVNPNEQGYITSANSSGFLSDPALWVAIDSGYGDRYYHAMGNYFPLPLQTDEGAYRYKLLDGKPVACTAQEIAQQEEAGQSAETSLWDELENAYREGVDSV